jgi:hypothetical protein
MTPPTFFLRARDRLDFLSLGERAPGFDVSMR